jgi:hypothetical protein
MADKLKFPEFDDIKVSTKTFVVKTNLFLNLKKLFDYLPITEYTVIPKKRGRKKKIGNSENNITVESGSIVTMKYENKIRGIELKQKKSQNSKKKKSKWFRNSFTIVMIIDNKPINFKICQNGVFQITGCKFDEHAEKCIKYIWLYIKHLQNIIYSFSEGENFESLFVPAMRNIDFSVGFVVDREKLSRYMSIQTEFHSLLETSFGYTGVNIKIPIDYDISKMEIKKIMYTNNKLDKDDNNEKNIDINKDWKEIDTYYQEYLDKLSDKEKNKKLNKERYNTFLIFHSGKTIMSSINAAFARDSYYYFIKIIKTAYDLIEERLDKS